MAAKGLEQLTLQILDPLCQFRNISKRASVPSQEEIESLWNQYLACGDSPNGEYICSDLEELLKQASIVETVFEKVDGLINKIMNLLQEGESILEEEELYKARLIQEEERIVDTCTCKHSTSKEPLEKSITQKVISTIASEPILMEGIEVSDKVLVEVALEEKQEEIVPEAIESSWEVINDSPIHSPLPSSSPSHQSNQTQIDTSTNPITAISSLNETTSPSTIQNPSLINSTIHFPTSSSSSISTSLPVNTTIPIPTLPLTTESVIQSIETSIQATSSATLSPVEREKSFLDEEEQEEEGRKVLEPLENMEVDMVIQSSVSIGKRRRSETPEVSSVNSKSKSTRIGEVLEPESTFKDTIEVVELRKFTSPRLSIPLRTYQFEGECGASGRQTCFLILQNQELSICTTQDENDSTVVLLECMDGGNEVMDIYLPDENHVPLVLFLQLRTANSRENAALRCGFDLRHPNWNRDACKVFFLALRSIANNHLFTCDTMSYGRQLEILVALEEAEDQTNSHRHTFSLGITTYGTLSNRSQKRLKKTPSSKVLSPILSSQYSTSLKYRLFYCDGLDSGGISFYFESSDRVSNRIELSEKDITGIRIFPGSHSQVLVVELKRGTLLPTHFEKTVERFNFVISNDDSEKSTGILRVIAKRFEQHKKLKFNPLTVEDESMIINEFEKATKGSGGDSGNLLSVLAAEAEPPVANPLPLPSTEYVQTQFTSNANNSLSPILSPILSTAPTPPGKSYILPLRLYRSGFAPNLDSEVHSELLSETAELQFILEASNLEDPSEDILAIKYFDTQVEQTREIVIVKASDKVLRSLMVPATVDEAYLLCFHIASSTGEIIIFQCSMDRNSKDWNPEIFRAVTTRLALWATKRGTISVEIYSLRFQLIIAMEMEESADCPMDQRRVLFIPLKTFSLGQNLSSLQTGTHACLLFHVMESKHTPPVLVVCSTVSGPNGRFSLSGKDIATIELPESNSYNPTLINLELTNLHSSAEFLDHFPAEVENGSHDLRLVIDCNSFEFMENEFKEICRRFANSWKSDDICISTLSLEAQTSLASTIMSQLPKPDETQIAPIHSPIHNHRKKSRARSPNRNSKSRNKPDAHRSGKGRSSSRRQNGNQNNEGNNQNNNSSKSTNFSPVNTMYVPDTGNGWGNRNSLQQQHHNYSNDDTGSFGKEPELDRSTSTFQENTASEWLPIPSVQMNY